MLDTFSSKQFIKQEVNFSDSALFQIATVIYWKLNKVIHFTAIRGLHSKQSKVYSLSVC